jgi:hypothetical protein
MLPAKISHLWSRISQWKGAREDHPMRGETEVLLETFGKVSEQRFDGTVIVDATWDNPNYWLRYSVIRKALGLGRSREIGLIGEFRRAQQSRTLARLGISEIADYLRIPSDRTSNRRKAIALLSGVSRPEELLELRLPLGLPAVFFYDTVLKRQRLSSVDCGDARMIDWLTEYLDLISKAERILTEYSPSLVISSHAIGIYLPLVWCALKRRIAVIVPFGDNGLLRLWKIDDPQQIFDFLDHPSAEHFKELDPTRKKHISQAGKAYLETRFAGNTTNLAVRYTYGSDKENINRDGLCALFGWDARKPIVGIYAANWFDYPHALGMASFRDFEDWILATYGCALRNPDVNWLFRAHPVDEWYGGMTLNDVMEKRQATHIRISEKHWNGQSVLNCIDAVITFHGTIGVEATALGKPVLVADRGWYDDWDFVARPKTRENYLCLLGKEWWTQMDRAKNADLARIFAGWYWGRPAWQERWLLEDDSEQWKLYSNIKTLLETSRPEIEIEAAFVREWFHSGYPHFHTYKMLKSDSYR